jgi:tetratricopeptide (TPR) repeat protein
VARPLFEEYKDALRRGHVALLGDEFEAAIDAYREAAALVPDRPLPHASLGTVLARLGRREEALEAFDRALALSPDDEATLRARAALAAGAVEADQGPVRAGPDAAAPTEVSEAPRVPETTEGPVAPPARETPGGPLAPEPGSEMATGQGGGSWPAIDLPSAPAPALLGPPPDPALLQAEADAFIDAGDPTSARDPLLLAAAAHREAGRLDAALDACLQLLAIAPGDPRVHLALANLELDRGWRPVATEKIELLLRLTSLSGDAQAEADVHLLAADRLRDESPTRLDARRRGERAP